MAGKQETAINVGPRPGKDFTPIKDLRTTAQNFKARGDAMKKIDPGSLAKTPNNENLKRFLPKK